MLELKHISKTFQQRKILDDLSIKFPKTGLIGIQGESGCGKSTLLYVIGMLDSDFVGDIFFHGEKISNREQFIREHISYMMQSKDVISSMTVKENIQLASWICQKSFTTSQLKKISHQLGLTTFLQHFPHQLSGGQLKRVSIAKALLKQSSIVLCDEPTGALHQAQAHEVMKLLKNLSEKSLVIIVSHDPYLLKLYCDDILTLQNGKLQGTITKVSTYHHEIMRSHFHTLMIYPIRQLISQKMKLLFLFIFQWIVILAFFIIVSAFQGFLDMLQNSEDHAVLAQVLQVEKYDGAVFDDMISYKFVVSCSYAYQLNQLQVKNNQIELSAILSFLPTQTDHLLIKQGRLPKQSHEVVVSEKLYQTLENKEYLHMSYLDYQGDFSIVGVLSSDLFSSDEIYCDLSLQNEVSFLKDNHMLIIEAQKGKTRNLYQLLQMNYFVGSDVIERVDNYQSLLKLAKMIAFVFIVISLFISLLLIGIVESIIYFERKHDVAYLLSLGLSKKRLFLLSILEAFFLGLMMGIGGSLISYAFYDYMQNVYQLSKHYYFDLQLKPIFFSQYDLFIIICLIYMMMTMIGALLPMRHMMKIDMIETLREE